MAGRGKLLVELESAVTTQDWPRVRRLAERLRYRAGWIPGERWRLILVEAGVEPWWLERASQEVTA